MPATEKRNVNASIAEASGAAQEWERQWWNNCANTFGEEAKQLAYAPRMGLVNTPMDGKWPVYDLAGKSVVDLGGGPASILLKTVNGDKLIVVDPCSYPAWVRSRYKAAGVRWVQEPAETWDPGRQRFDEAWIYNVLQHVVDPQQVIEKAMGAADVVRIFEWIDTGINVGHPHSLAAYELDDWLGGNGRVEEINSNGAVGRCYSGSFPSVVLA